MVKKWYVTIPELTGTEKRRVYLYLPASYRRNKDQYYPVLYMFDGHNVFFDSDATYGKSWGMKEYMDRTRTQMIIVAVECNHSPDNGRLSEYSPYDFYFQDAGKIKGRGRLTMNWITKVLKPFIDSNYRTLSDREHTYIAGSSMGGLMSFYALIAYNKVFSKACALSPSLWVDPDKLIRLIARTKIRQPSTIYLDYGSLEIPSDSEMVKEFWAFCGYLAKKNITVTGRVIPGGTHCEASWEKQIPIFMNTTLCS